VPISQLLSKFLDTVNLGKILVDGGPGVILATALLLFACHYTGRSPLKLVGDTEVKCAEKKVKQDEGELKAKATEAAKVDQKLQCWTKATALAEEARTRIALPAETAAREAKARETCGDPMQLQSNKARLAKESEFTAKDLEEARADLEKRRQEQVRDGRGILIELINLLLGLSILGYVLGTLFSSVYRVIFFRFIPRFWHFTFRFIPFFWHFTFGRIVHSRRVRRTIPVGDKALLALGPLMQGEELRHGGVMILETKNKAEAIERLEKLSPELLEKGGKELTSKAQLETYPASYYVGRGIISQQDYDGFVTDYYRWAEAAANTSFPTLLFGFALYHWLPNRSTIVLAAVVSLVLCLAALAAHTYYKRQLRYFIKGALKREEEKGKQVVPSTAPRPPRQRLEIIAEGDEAAAILKRLEDCLKGSQKPSPESAEGKT